MDRSRRGWMYVLALPVALLVVGCASNSNVVSCHSDFASRSSDVPGLTITYSGDGIEMEVIGPSGTLQLPVSESEITIDSGPAKLADMGTLTPGTYRIHMKDTVGTRTYFTFEAIVAERQVTRLRLICK